MELFLLRVLYSAPAAVAQARWWLLLALVLGVLRFWYLRRRNPSPRIRFGASRLLEAGIVATLVLAYLPVAERYQGKAERVSQWQKARVAPVRHVEGSADGVPLQIFTAPRCTFCMAIEKWIESGGARGYRIEFIPSSFDGVAWAELEAAMCAPDPMQQFRRLHRLEPPETQDPEPAPPCSTRVKENAAALRSIGRYAFPTLILPDGFRMIGASPSKVSRYLQALAAADAKFEPKGAS
jgi:hypothetical protein